MLKKIFISTIILSSLTFGTVNSVGQERAQDRREGDGRTGSSQSSGVELTPRDKIKDEAIFNCLDLEQKLTRLKKINFDKINTNIITIKQIDENLNKIIIQKKTDGKDTLNLEDKSKTLKVKMQDLEKITSSLFSSKDDSSFACIASETDFRISLKKYSTSTISIKNKIQEVKDFISEQIQPQL